MIAILCTCSCSWCQSKVNDSIPLTGVVTQTDSVLISINDIKVANAKMIELKYEKEINENLIATIQTDSVLINALSTNLSACEITMETRINEIKKERNIAIGAGAGTSLLFLVLLIIAL